MLLGILKSLLMCWLTNTMAAAKIECINTGKRMAMKYYLGSFVGVDQ